MSSAPGHKLTVPQLHRLLEQRGWDRERISTAIVESVACGDIHQTSGGRSLVFTDIERGGGSAGVGLYNRVKRVLLKHGLPRVYCGEPEVLETARLRNGDGRVWIAPDLVLRCRGRGAAHGTPKVLHTLEIEAASGFSIRSIYQAHAQGWGADYSWVLFKCRSGTEPLQGTPDGARMLDVARTLGVGLVSFENENSVNTWSLQRKADRRSDSRTARRQFANLISPATH